MSTHYHHDCHHERVTRYARRYLGETVVVYCRCADCGEPLPKQCVPSNEWKPRPRALGAYVSANGNGALADVLTQCKDGSANTNDKESTTMPMCLSEFRQALKERGFDVSTQQVHYALDRGHVTKPSMGGDHRYRFGTEHVDEFAKYLESKREASTC